MNSILVLVVGIGILIAGYVFYGKWLAGQWGVDPKRKTPAFTEEDRIFFYFFQEIFFLNAVIRTFVLYNYIRKSLCFQGFS